MQYNGEKKLHLKANGEIKYNLYRLKRKRKKICRVGLFANCFHSVEYQEVFCSAAEAGSGRPREEIYGWRVKSELADAWGQRARRRLVIGPRALEQRRWTLAYTHTHTHGCCKRRGFGKEPLPSASHPLISAPPLSNELNWCRGRLSGCQPPPPWSLEATEMRSRESLSRPSMEPLAQLFTFLFILLNLPPSSFFF